ncbi:hypothetical protein OPV22_004262 [Ensete ventricosum]|uniref:Magnesium transporter n=1 Tax=Ensete ventricosum TaxID=4639 RepID=A0AAV8S2W9_ENSVE|nr:hypothetical protein OPV22_004262 [Ensete ventricosum]
MCDISQSDLSIGQQGSYSPIPRGPVGGIASASPPLLFAEHCDGDSSQISPYTFTSVGIGISVLGAACLIGAAIKAPRITSKNLIVSSSVRLLL